LSGYGFMFTDDCWRKLVELYGGNEEDADEAGNTLEWRLMRDPLKKTRRAPVLGEHLTYLKPFKEHPALGLAFRIETEEHRQNVVMTKVWRTNLPDGLS
jgi:hypothetical protein